MAVAHLDNVALEARLLDDILEFDGVDDFIDVGDPGVVEGAAFTIEAWVRVPAGETDDVPTIYSENTPANWSTSDLFILYAGSSFDGDSDGNEDGVRVYFVDSAGTGGDVLLANQKVDDGNWHHLVVRQSASDSRELLVDLIIKDTDTTSLGTVSVTDAYIGAAEDNGTMTRFCNPGTQVREVRVWNDYRTDAELADNQNVQLTGAEAGLVAYWQLDEGTGTTANDDAGANDGTINGATWITSGSPFWTDLWPDVRLTDQVIWDYGIKGQRVEDRVAGTGRMRFSLDNSEGNSAGLLGYYSPGHANVRDGWNTEIECRIVLTEGGTDHVKFHGVIKKIIPQPGTKGKRKVDCLVLDWMHDAAEHKLNLLPVEENSTSGAIVQSVVENMDKRPQSLNIDTGQETFAHAPDDVKDEKTVALAVLSRVTISEFGYLAYIGGELRFWNRHARVKETTVSATLDDTIFDIFDVDRDEKDVYQRVKTTTYPREVGTSNEVLYSLVTPIQIQPGDTEVVQGRYRDPNNQDVRISGKDMVTPVEGTDYEFSSSEGGGGDLNSDLSVTANYGGNSVEYQLTNNGSTAGFVTILQARGTAIRTYDPAISISEKSNPAVVRNKQVKEIDLAYQDDPLRGQDFGDNTLSKVSAPRDIVRRVGFIANQNATAMSAALEVEPGDRVVLSETLTGINDEFFVNHVTYILTSGIDENLAGSPMMKVRWTPVVAATESYWVLGTSQLGIDAALGF